MIVWSYCYWPLSDGWGPRILLTATTMAGTLGENFMYPPWTVEHLAEEKQKIIQCLDFATKV